MPVDQPTTSQTATWRGRLREWESNGALVLIAAVYSIIQAASPNILGIDGYYHVKVAELMRAQGWRFLAPLDFPWLQLTILGPGRYTDHHWLFHVLQVPFTFGDPRVGAKMAAVMFAIFGLYTTYRFLARFDVRYPLLWIALLVACAPTFLWRQSMARTQSLSLLLIVAGLWVLFAGYSRQRLALGCVVVGALMALLFNGFFFVLGAPIAAVLAGIAVRLLPTKQSAVSSQQSAEESPSPACGAVGRRRAEGPHGTEGRESSGLPGRVEGGWGGGRWLTRLVAGVWHDPMLAALAWTVVGVILGFVIHPYFPRNVEFAFFHLLPKAIPMEQPDVPVGLEWYPYSLSGFMTRVGPSAAVAVSGLVPLGLALWRRERLDWRALVLGILAFGFLAMVARSQRMIEYSPAFSIVFGAWAWSHTPAVGAVWAQLTSRFAERWHDHVPSRLLQIWTPGRILAPWIAGLILLPIVVTSTLVASREATSGTAWDTYRDGALWLAEHTPADSRVFTTDWDDFPHMFFWDTHNTYLVGLDPTYMSLEDPELYKLWYAISQGKVNAPSRTIRETFNSPYVLTDLKHKQFVKVAEADPGLQVVLRTPTVIVYRVLGG
jgi:hypothetical protein